MARQQLLGHSYMYVSENRRLLHLLIKLFRVLTWMQVFTSHPIQITYKTNLKENWYTQEKIFNTEKMNILWSFFYLIHTYWDPSSNHVYIQKPCYNQQCYKEKMCVFCLFQGEHKEHKYPWYSLLGMKIINFNIASIKKIG